MNEFGERYAKLSTSQRRQIRIDMRERALKQLGGRLGMFSTNRQMKAAARRMVDMAIGKARAV